jgi:hypothetical protein
MYSQAPPFVDILYSALDPQDITDINKGGGLLSTADKIKFICCTELNYFYNIYSLKLLYAI